MNTIVSKSLGSRRDAVESALNLQNAEIQTALSNARKGGEPKEWLSRVDPDLIALLIKDDSVVHQSSEIQLPKSTIKAMQDGIRGAILVGEIPTEYWSIPHPQGTALILRMWNSSRISQFQRMANCIIFFSLNHLSEPDQTSESVQVRRTLMSSAGTEVGTLVFETKADELSEARESANESAGLIVAASVSAMGVLFVILHRKVFEPLRLINAALETQSIEPNKIISNPDEFGETMRQLQRVFVQKRLLSTANDELERIVKIRTQDLETAYDATIAGFSMAMELRDKETEGHCQRVAGMTVMLAKQLGVSDEEVIQMRRGALLHDVGKLGVPDSILLKAGPLTDDEYELMKKHTILGYDMLKSIPFLKGCLDIPLHHHEKWDGTGYPCGLKGQEIPLSARMFALADVYDALRSDRPYRKGMSDQEVKEHIRSLAGTHFDPYLVAVFDRIDCNAFWCRESTENAA